MWTSEHQCEIFPTPAPAAIRAARTEVGPVSSPIDLADARVRRTRERYRGTVAEYLGARTDDERVRLGKAMYFAQLATIEARHNPEGCAAFIAAADALTSTGGRRPRQLAPPRRAA